MALGRSPASGARLVARPLYSFGLAAITFGFGLYHNRVLATLEVDFLRSEASLWWSVLALALIVFSYSAGLPELAGNRWSAFGRGLLSTVAAFGVILVCQAILARPLLPRSASGLVAVVVPLWTVIAWNLAQDATSRAAERDRVFVFAERREDVDSVEADLAAEPEAPASVVGRMSPAQAERRTATEVAELVRFADASIVVLDAASQASTVVVEAASLLHRRGLRVRTLSLFYEEWIGKLPHAELARVSLLFDVGELHRVRYVRFKRVVDLAFSVMSMSVLVPLIVAVAVANPFLNPGPLLFRQTRIGRDGVPFTMYKLRTMTPDAERGHGRWTALDDARVTPLGRWLRRTHLDELPQILNIVRGDLSLVGPRPEQPLYVDELAEKMDFYEVRHIVRPGITGWAQVKQGYAADEADAFEKLQYDFYYLRRQSATFDVRIVWRTLRGVVGGDGR